METQFGKKKVTCFSGCLYLKSYSAWLELFVSIMSSDAGVMGWLESHYWKTPGWSTCKFFLYMIVYAPVSFFDVVGIGVFRETVTVWRRDDWNIKKAFEKLSQVTWRKQIRIHVYTESRIDTFLLQFYHLWPLNSSACNYVMQQSYHLRVQIAINHWACW